MTKNQLEYQKLQEEKRQFNTNTAKNVVFETLEHVPILGSIVKSFTGSPQTQTNRRFK